MEKQLSSRNPKRKKWLTGCLLTILIALIGFIILTIVLTATMPDPVAETDKAADTTQTTDQSDQETPYSWQYWNKTDPMTSAEIHYARILSTTYVDFDFPYNGGSQFYLWVRNKDGKNEVFLQVDNGQFMSNLGNDHVRIRFDQNQAISLNYTHSDDGSLDYLFLDHPTTIINGLKNTHACKIEAPFYQEGRKVLTFMVGGFDWDH